ncbi:MAG: hypothetical protein HQL12_00090 [Candidatus Omnitrophica bacterium]|nr:hypothetical protein [Candidatus Omnitrophota bacterium]
MKRAPLVHIFILIAFLVNTFGTIPLAQADEFHLPSSGVMVHVSPEFNPPILKGIKIHPDNPFKFDFILDRGDTPSRLPTNEPLNVKATRLIKYFLASLTTPEQDLWVNLSPYEKSRIIPQSFGQTDMGRDLLAEDYMLKQITASLIYPEGEIGRQFWKRIYEQAQKKFGTTDIPVNTFNKVWIVPEHAKVYEHGNTALVVKARLKVMLEQDYLALSKNQRPTWGHVPEGDVSPSTLPSDPGLNVKAPQGNNGMHTLASQIIREVVIPELEKEVNEGKNFATLRQVYYSLILAVWFKKRMKDSIIGRKYIDQNKVEGIHYDHSIQGLMPSRLPSEIALNVKAPQGKNLTPNDIEFIYQRYLKAFKKGVYNYIKEESDPVTQKMIPRKYFSGGAEMSAAMNTTEIGNILTPEEENQIPDSAQVSMVKVELADVAMTARGANNGHPDRVTKTVLLLTTLATMLWLGVQYVHEKHPNHHSTPTTLTDLLTGEKSQAQEIYEGKVRSPVANGEFVTSTIQAGQCVAVVRIDKKGKMTVGHLYKDSRKNLADLDRETYKFIKISGLKENEIVNLYYVGSGKPLDEVNAIFHNEKIKTYKHNMPLAGQQSAFIYIEKHGNAPWNVEATDGFGETIKYTEGKNGKLEREDNAMTSAGNVTRQIDQLERNFIIELDSKRPIQLFDMRLGDILGEESEGAVYVDQGDPAKFYKIFHKKEEGINELTYLKYLELKNISGVPRVLAWGKMPNDQIWLHLEGIENASSIRVRRLNAVPLSKVWNSISLLKRLEILTRVAEILRDIHDLGISHNDVKPSNIIVNAKGEVMLIDWGIASILGNRQIAGTGDFKAPEDFKIDESDVYSLGRTIYSSILLELSDTQVSKNIDVVASLSKLREEMTMHKAKGRPSMKKVAGYLGQLTAEADTSQGTAKIGHPESKAKVVKGTAMINGGIDLTANRMNLDMDSDKSAVAAPMDMKALENLEIHGLYIKDIEIKPLNNLPELLGVPAG